MAPSLPPIPSVDHALPGPMLRAGPGGEVWHHTNDRDIKFKQFGWRSNKSENIYNPYITLIGNWYEQSRDFENAKRAETYSNVSK